MKNVSFAAMTMTAISFLMLTAGCIGTDLSDIAQDDGLQGDGSQEDITPDDGASDDGALAESQSALTTCPNPSPSEGPGTSPSACDRYCVYELNGDSSISTFGCYDSAEEANAYRGSFLTSKVLASFDTLNGNGDAGKVTFLIKNNLPCTASRKYQIPDLTKPIFGNLNDTFVNATGNIWSGCGRIRVWEDITFNGYSLSCIHPGWCTDDLIDGNNGALNLNQKVSSWRALEL